MSINWTKIQNPPKGENVDSNQIISKIEEIGGQSLEEEQKLEIELWQRGRTLAAVPPHAVEEIQVMLEGYVRKDADDLIAEDPANRDAVIARHAQAHASARLLVRFQSDFQNAIKAASRTPDVVKNGIRYVSQVPPDAL